MKKRMSNLVKIVGCLLLLGAATFLAPRGAARQEKQDAPDGLWRQAQEESLRSRNAQRRIVPEVYRTVRLDGEALRARLRAVPMEFTPEGRASVVEMTLPMPEGGYQRFRIVESPMMAPELAAQVPDFKTYAGQGIDDPTATLRFDVTPEGFHAIVFTAKGTIYVDPYAKGDVEHYISYFKRDFTREEEQFRCSIAQQAEALGETRSRKVVTTGGTLHVYDLALAATGQYTNFFRQTGDSDAQARTRALAAMTTTMNRVNGLFERDLNVRMSFVANELNIIYTDPATDPYTDANPAPAVGNNTGAIGGDNQTNLDGTIGNANYDIGHVFGIGGGGNAGGIGTVCGGSKGAGYTMRGNPTGDPFDVDYVAHEMGHQFGGTHTFNDNTNCDGGQYTGSSAYEPGSASTIMGYAGICGAANLQRNSDAYFHVRSVEQIVAKVNGDACDVEIATGNAAPAVDPGANFTIPRQTPFALTATGSDPNGDALTFCWEQYDLGAASPAEGDNGDRPIFRSYNPTADGTRTFPSLPYILNNANVPPATYSSGGTNFLVGESLPSTNRTMRFQVAARDNRAGGGGLSSAEAQVTVTTSSGPFAVTQPNTLVSWPAGTTQTITWDVANTTAAPVSCANVRLLLSTDGGLTFPITLAASTPNDGSESFVVPSLISAQARIKVQAVGNIFFDISDANFRIEPAADLEIVSMAASPDPVLTGSQLTYMITVRNNGPTAASNVTVTDNLPAGAIFNGCAATGGGVCGGAGQNRTISFATLAAGQSEAITITAEANCALADGALIVNTASVASPDFDPNPANNSGADTVTAQNPPPVIDQPADFDAVAATPGSTTGIVTFPDPNVTDNCPGVTIVCAPASGSAFPLGTTTVTCTATDSGGAMASTSFQVTVWDACIKDEARGDFILFNTFTGVYKFVVCGPSGFVMTGQGVITREGCTTTLRDDTRVVGASFDRCHIAPRNSGTAVMKRRQPDISFWLNDRNILNNSPTCTP
ncbi:MAG: M12 family metallo-peptidase [Blastocatellia bacterium]|nr:M12 family metallo-peptidase [Blastocatellia bacterium]